MTTTEKTEKGFVLTVDGVRIPISFTLETGEVAVERFRVLLSNRESEFLSLEKDYTERLNWNHTHRGEGTVFGRMEKFLKQLQKVANIIDS